MTVAARFYVGMIEFPPEGTSTGTVVHLNAVCRGAANSTWASATPAGTIRMVIRNDLATQQFEQGKEYEVTFTPVETPKLGDGHSVSAYDSHGYWTCGVCGFYAQNQTPPVDGKPAVEAADVDWSQHDEHFKK